MLLRFAVLTGLVSALLCGAEHRGTVKSNGLPIPGATITARQGDQQLTTSSDESGVYVFANLPPGVWTIEAEMPGFTVSSKQVQMAGTPAATDFEIRVLGPGAAVAAVKPQPVQARSTPAQSAPAQTAQAQPEPAKPEPPAQAKPTPAPQRQPQQGPRQQQALGQRGQGAPAGARQDQNGAFQRLEVVQTAQNETLTAMNQSESAPQLSENANESFLVNGSLSRGLQSTQNMDDFFQGREELRARFEQMRAQGGMPGGGQDGPGGMGGPGGMRGPGGGGPPMMGGGGPGGFGGRGMGGPGGPGGFGGRGGSSRGDPRARGGPGGRRPPDGTTMFGNRRGRGREGYHGGASFTLRNSAFDAKPYSINGQNIDKPSYAASRFSLMGGGMLRIPKIVTDEKTIVFFSYFGTRARNPFDQLSTLPSPIERGGNFSQSIANGPVTIFDPLTSQPFPGNLVPASRIDPAAQGMLGLIPLPNQPGIVQNYHIVTSVPQNSDNFSTRVNRSITRKDRLSGSWSVQQRNGSNTQLYGFKDSSSGRGMSTDVSWTHNIAAGLFTSTRFSFSRNSSRNTPFFAFGDNWAATLGILGTSQDPRNYGPPNVSFTNFGGLNDGSLSTMHNQTASVSQSLTRVKGKHTRTFGFDFRRIQLNSVTDSNARGSYTFSGLSTSGFDAGGIPMANTGFDFADFLLGLPQSSSIRYGSSDIYFRSSAYNAFGQDDWRVLSNLSLNFGFRYEILTPIHEKYGRMANLDIAPNFTGVAVVTPNQPGPYTGTFPGGLVNPDHNNVAPRFGFAWRPFKGRQTQVRGGYGWYFNGSVYNTAASRMAQQPPFAKTQSVNTSLQRTLTIRDGFLAATTKAITNTFAIDRNYHVGYAQTWNFAIQQDLPASIVVEAGYLGTKGTRLDVQRMPNRAAPGSPLTSEQRRLIGNATGFTFDSADGNSIYHAGQFRFSRRFRKGISANVMYTLSKSIDNASSIGGGGGVVAQDDHNLAAERGVSSFDRTHSLNASFLLSTGGPGASGATRSRFVRDWSLMGGFTVQSGSPFTAMVLGNRSDAGGSGAIGSGRADATGLPLFVPGYFFNPAAFAIPPAGRYGNAARNTIRGPSSLGMNMSFGRSIRFGETRRALDLRMEANNVLNTVNVTRVGATVNASNYGLALDAGNMRSMNLNVRFRF